MFEARNRFDVDFVFFRFFPSARRERRRQHAVVVQESSHSLKLKKKQNARANMAPHEAPAADTAAAAVAVKEQQPPRPSSGSDLDKENTAAGIISNESLTVRDRSGVAFLSALLLKEIFLSVSHRLHFL